MTQPWLERSARSGLVLVAGAASVLGFAPFGQFWVPILALGLWFFCIIRSPSVGALRLGYLFGLGYFGTGVSWIQVSAHQFGVPHILFSGGVTLAFVLVLALYFAAAGGVAARLTPQASTVPRLVALAASVWLFEWLRGWLFSGFPWQLLGYSQVGGPLQGALPLFGTPGASALMLVLAALFAHALDNGRRNGLAAAGQPVLFAAALVIAVQGVGRVPFTEPAGPPIRVALLQGNVPQHLKWAPSQFLPTVALYRELTDRALATGVDLIIWPESAIPAFATQVRELLHELQAQAEANDTTFFIGIPRRVDASDGDTSRYFNSVLSLGPEVGLYDKRHLVPFGEYLPLSGVLERPLSALGVRLAAFVPGPVAQPLLRVSGQPVGVSICFEDVFAREVARALPAAALLVNVSNDAWFGDSLAPHQHMQIARARAIEAGRPMLRATNTGISAVTDHRGRLAAVSPQFETDLLLTEVTPRRGMTPYIVWGDWPMLALCLGGLIYARRRARRSAPSTTSSATPASKVAVKSGAGESGR